MMLVQLSLKARRICVSQKRSRHASSLQHSKLASNATGTAQLVGASRLCLPLRGTLKAQAAVQVPRLHSGREGDFTAEITASMRPPEAVAAVIPRFRSRGQGRFASIISSQVLHTPNTAQRRRTPPGNMSSVDVSACVLMGLLTISGVTAMIEVAKLSHSIAERRKPGYDTTEEEEALEMINLILIAYRSPGLALLLWSAKRDSRK